MASQLEANVQHEMALLDERGDDAEDSDDQLPEIVILTNTQRMERAWREVKRGLHGQPLSLLRRNLNVEMFRFNSLPSSLSFEEKRGRFSELLASIKRS